MKQDLIYKEVERIAKDRKLMERYYAVDSFPEGEPYFTTTQEADIWDMIRDGMEADDIIYALRKRCIIRKW